MVESRPNTSAKILVFTVVVEMATGLALLANPQLVVTLLLGAEVLGTGILLGRCFGITLACLAVACWPDRNRHANGAPPFWGMLAYNALIALYLAYLGTVGKFSGVLLWPAVLLHAVVALLFVWSWHRERSRT